MATLVHVEGTPAVHRCEARIRERCRGCGETVVFCQPSPADMNAITGRRFRCAVCRSAAPLVAVR